MTRTAVIVLLVVTAALLQTALFPLLPFGGYRPDLLLLIAVAFAMREGPLTGTIVGFGCGLLTDLLLDGSPLGLYALVLLFLGYSVGVIRPYVAAASLTVPIATAFVTGVIAIAAYATLSRLLGDPRFTLDVVIPTALVVAIFNAILAVPAFALVGRLVARFPSERPG